MVGETERWLNLEKIICRFFRVQRHTFFFYFIFFPSVLSFSLAEEMILVAVSAQKTRHNGLRRVSVRGLCMLYLDEGVVVKKKIEESGEMVRFYDCWILSISA